MASGIPALEIVFNLNSMGPPVPSPQFLFGASDLPNQHEHRIIKFIHNALFQRNDRIIRDVDLLGAHFCAALGDVAETDAELILKQLGASLRVERMHFEPRDPYEEPRSSELFHLLMLAENVAHVLT